MRPFIEPSKSGINFVFGGAGHAKFRVARFLLGLEQAVFVEPQTARDGALPHHYVVFLAAGEVREREGKFFIRHHAQVGLNAAGENHAGLGVALGADAENAGTRDPLLAARLAGERRQMQRLAGGLAQRLFVLPWMMQAPVGVPGLSKLVASQPLSAAVI